MSETMTVYFASRTGHVLGAATRAAGMVPATPRAASVEEVLVQVPLAPAVSIDLDFPGFLVPAQELSTLVLATDLNLVLNPLGFQILSQTDSVLPLDVTPKIAGVTLRSIPTTGTTEITIGLDPSDVDRTQDRPALALIVDDKLTVLRIAPGVVPKTVPVAVMEVPPLPRGSYHVMALVSGRLPFAAVVDLGP